MRLPRLGYLVLAVWMFGVASADAEPSKLSKEAATYAQKNKLPIRRIKRDLGTREVDRIFVPVLPKTVESFTETFSLQHGAMTWRAAPTDLVHGMMNVEPHQAMQHNTAANAFSDDASIMDPTLGGNYVTFALAKKAFGSWRNQLKKWSAGGSYWNAMNGYTEDHQRELKGQACFGGCMWWVVHWELPNGTNLAHYLGVQRAKGPEVLFPRVVHSGNENVGPIGVAVKSISEFKKMTDDELFGPEPAGGAADRVFPRPPPQKIPASKAAKMMGQHVFVATGSAMPSDLLSQLRNEAMKRKDPTEVYYMSTFAAAQNFAPAVAKKFHPNLFFISEQNREAAANGTATLHRDSLFNLSQQIIDGTHPIDTVVVRVSPPDKDGMVSLGTTGDLTLVAVERAMREHGKIIAEVNPNVPHTYGNRIPYNALSMVVESKGVLPDAPARVVPLATEKEIAKNVAKLVPANNATIQVGIGNALAGMGEALTDKKHMRIWSELGSDWALPLLSKVKGRAPVVKEAVFSFLHGSNALYKLADNNKAIRIGSTYEVNNPATIGEQKNMRAINTALEVDVLGNVNAERIGKRIISFPGGQPDFMKGASESQDGRAILALRSLTKTNGSTIVLQLNGEMITTPGNNVDHVVTEFGSTPLLRDLDASGRASALIQVAHPIHRRALADQARAAGQISQEQRDEIVAGVQGAIAKAPRDIRRKTAELALANKIITKAIYEKIIATCPRVVAEAH